ncbi:MAG: NIPSNAP family protein [Tannerella sp.]|nr:NIPSNAP family protein [Tannerella sp.]
MQRRNFIKMAGVLAATPALATNPAVNSLTSTSAGEKEIYECRIYSLNGDGDKLDEFFKETLIPAYSRQGVTVGAFKPYKPEDGEQRYLLFIYPNIGAYLKTKKAIWDDQTFKRAAQPFFDATAPQPLYSRFETILSEAFDKIPVHRTPGKERTLFELRVYQSPNEEANKRKVKMFNADEIAIFDQTGVNSVLYGDILAGPRQPALMYLTWYKDEPTRNEAWKQFGGHPDWQRISKLPEYAHTATNNKSTLLSPLDYSQL